MPDITDDRDYKRVIMFELTEEEWTEFSKRPHAGMTPMDSKIWNNMYRLTPTTMNKMFIGEFI